MNSHGFLMEINNDGTDVVTNTDIEQQAGIQAASDITKLSCSYHDRAVRYRKGMEYARGMAEEKVEDSTYWLNTAERQSREYRVWQQKSEMLEQAAFWILDQIPGSMEKIFELPSQPSAQGSSEIVPADIADWEWVEAP